MSWKCPECEYYNEDYLRRCVCGHEIETEAVSDLENKMQSDDSSLSSPVKLNHRKALETQNLLDIVGLFIYKSIRNACVLAAIYIFVGIFFWERSLPFMLSSILKNIPFLLVAGIFITIFEMIELIMKKYFS